MRRAARRTSWPSQEDASDLNTSRTVAVTPPCQNQTWDRSKKDRVRRNTMELIMTVVRQGKPPVHVSLGAWSSLRIKF